MARAPGDHNAASLGQKVMTRSVQCPECGVVLNVPEEAAGRKLKCPKCATKFAAPSFGPADSVIAESGPASTMFPTRKGPPSSGDFDLPGRMGGSSGSIELPVSGRKGSSGSIDLPVSGRKGSSGSIDLPSSPAPLRDTFDLPLLGEDLLPTKGPSKAPASAPADVLALFQDEPKSNRKPTGAEARSKARRCPDCGGVVAIGMSLCNTCGLDLDTGRRTAPMEIFEDEMPVVRRQETPPIGVLLVGGFTAMVNLILAFASIVSYAKGQGVGVLCLTVIWGFGIYGAVQLLRRKSVRPLMLASGLGVAIGVVYLIALPIWEINVGTDTPLPTIESPVPVDPDTADDPKIQNLADQLDMQRITWGIAVLIGYAALAVYMNSPQVHREFKR